MTTPPILLRMWVNQPSTLQPLHHLHGTNVLAATDYGDTYRIFFLSGDVISQQAPRNALSAGWLNPSIIAVERFGDQSVRVVFGSCHAASKFERSLK